MAGLNISWDTLNSINQDSLSDEKERKKILNFLYQLTEQLQYWQTHLELDNMTDEFQQDYAGMKTATVTLRKTSDSILMRVEDAEGRLSRFELTADGLEGRIENAEGDITELQIGADGLETRVEDAEKGVGALEVAADELRMSVSEKLDADAESVGVKNSAATLTAEEFTLSFDGKNVFEIDRDSAVFDVDTLTATGQIIGNVVNTQKAAAFTVPSGASIQSVIDNLGKYLLGNVDVYVQGQHTENVQIHGFCGIGNLSLRFQSGAVLQGSIEVKYCQSVSILGPSQTECCILSKADICIFVYSVNRCYIGKVNMQGDGRNRGLMCEYATVYVETSNFAGFVKGIESATDSQMSVLNCIGGGTGDNALSTYAAVANGGAMLTLWGTTRPMGTLYDNNGAGLIRDAGTTPTSASGEVPVVKQTMTVKPSSSKGAVYGTADGTGGYVHPWGYYTNPFQGKNAGAGGYMFGVWLYEDGLSGLRTAISGKTVEAATLTLKRADAYGVDGSTVHLFYHSKTGVVSSDRPSEILTSTGLSAQVDRGKTVTFTLTSDLIAKLQNGTIQGFGLSSAGSTELMQFDGTVCDLTVVYS